MNNFFFSNNHFFSQEEEEEEMTDCHPNSSLTSTGLSECKLR